MQWLEVSETDWLDTLQVNTMPAVRMIRVLLPTAKQNGWGRIINIASTAGSQPIAYGPDYGAAKSAALNMSVSLGKSLGACGVTVNSISGGVILSPIVRIGSQGCAECWGDVSLKEAERLMTQQILPVPVGKSAESRISDM